MDDSIKTMQSGVRQRERLCPRMWRWFKMPTTGTRTRRYSEQQVGADGVTRPVELSEEITERMSIVIDLNTEWYQKANRYESVDIIYAAGDLNLPLNWRNPDIFDPTITVNGRANEVAYYGSRDAWTFTLGYELTVAGKYEVHLTLNGAHLNGSPVLFRMKPAAPSGRLSTLHPPVDTPPVIGVEYMLTLIAVDKYSNKLDRGGANVQPRAGGPAASPAAAIDNGDGTYGVKFTAGAAGEYRIEVRLDNVKIKGSPHLINFSEPTAAQRRQLAAAGAEAAAAKPAGAEVRPAGDTSFDVSDGDGSPQFMRPDQPTERSQDSPPGSSRTGSGYGSGFDSARAPGFDSARPASSARRR